MQTLLEGHYLEKPKKSGKPGKLVKNNKSLEKNCKFQ